MLYLKNEGKAIPLILQVSWRTRNTTTIKIKILTNTIYLERIQDRQVTGAKR